MQDCSSSGHSATPSLWCRNGVDEIKSSMKGEISSPSSCVEEKHPTSALQEEKKNVCDRLHTILGGMEPDGIGYRKKVALLNREILESHDKAMEVRIQHAWWCWNRYSQAASKWPSGSTDHTEHARLATYWKYKLEALGRERKFWQNEAIVNPLYLTGVEPVSVSLGAPVRDFVFHYPFTSSGLVQIGALPSSFLPDSWTLTKKK